MSDGNDEREQELVLLKAKIVDYDEAESERHCNAVSSIARVKARRPEKAAGRGTDREIHLHSHHPFNSPRTDEKSADFQIATSVGKHRLGAWVSVE